MIEGRDKMNFYKLWWVMVVEYFFWNFMVEEDKLLVIFGLVWSFNVGFDD